MATARSSWRSIGSDLPAMRLRAWPGWARVGGAAAVALLAFWLSRALQLAADGFTFLLIYPAVLVCAHLWGRIGGYACTAAAALAIGLLMRTDEALPSRAMSASMAALFLFIVAGLLASVLVSTLNRALRQLEQAHAKAVASELEKDLLLRELRHRIKNDLANIAAILQIEARKLDGGAADAVRRAVDRIHVIARLHTHLERDRHSPVVEAGPFLRDLCSDFTMTFLRGSGIQLQVWSDELALAADEAVSVGLIANELITNALKHAFPGGRTGTIRLSLLSDGKSTELLVSDDGIGAPVEPAPGSGHRLMQALVRRLSAQLERDHDVANGTSWRVRFVRK